MLNVCKDIHQSWFINSCKENYSHLYLTEKGRLLKSFCARSIRRHATDSSFQKTWRRSGLKYVKCKEYFSAKHQAYGNRSKISFSPNGLCVCSLLPAEVETELIILCFQKKIGWHCKTVSKFYNDSIFKVGEELSDHIKNSRAILIDIGY